MTDATLTLNTSNGNSKVLIDPTNGIKIQKNSGGTWTDQFAVDNTGNINFAGTLTGATGTFSGAINATSGNIGGLNISSSGLAYDSNNYIASDGTLKWGGLYINGSTATFDGTIYASNINGQITSGQISSLNADKINAGTLTGMYIFGSTIAWSGAYLTNTGVGYTLLHADASVTIYGGATGTTLSVGDGTYGVSTNSSFRTASNLYVNGTAYFYGTSSFSNRAYFTGGITAGGNNGFTGAVDLRAYSGAGIYLQFYSGIMYNYILH